jgi:hypothetical protein
MKLIIDPKNSNNKLWITDRWFEKSCLWVIAIIPIFSTLSVFYRQDDFPKTFAVIMYGVFAFLGIYTISTLRKENKTWILWNTAQKIAFILGVPLTFLVVFGSINYFIILGGSQGSNAQPHDRVSDFRVTDTMNSAGDSALIHEVVVPKIDDCKKDLGPSAIIRDGKCICSHIKNIKKYELGGRSYFLPISPLTNTCVDEMTFDMDAKEFCDKQKPGSEFIGIKEDGTMKCECDYSSFFGEVYDAGDKCIMGPSNSHYLIDKGWSCDLGYYTYKKSCYTLKNISTVCQDVFGSGYRFLGEVQDNGAYTCYRVGSKPKYLNP